MKVTVVTGAGVSASAGIPTYRDQGGNWSDENFEKMSHAQRYGNYLPALIPKWLTMGSAMLSAQPTPFHRAIADRGWGVVTQNVDGLHQRAGSSGAIEVHGTLMNWRGLHAKSPGDLTLQDLLKVQGMVDVASLRVRPDVVLFGEKPRMVKDAMKLIRQSDVVVFAGTSGNVFPVADWYTLAPRSVLVDPAPWGNFSKVFPMKTDEWAAMGCPLE